MHNCMQDCMYINAFKGRLEILVFSVQTTHFHTVYKCAVPSKTEVIERVRINQWYHLYHFDSGTKLKTKLNILIRPSVQKTFMYFPLCKEDVFNAVHD